MMVLMKMLRKRMMKMSRLKAMKNVTKRSKMIKMRNLRKRKVESRC